MDISKRRVDIQADQELVLEFHCLGNYESDVPWFRRAGWDGYRKEWLATPQPGEFLASLEDSLADSRTVAEIWEANGESIGFLWVTFSEVTGYDISLAEIRDLEVSPTHQRRGIGRLMLKSAERVARAAGATALRSETGIPNDASQALHAKGGFETYRVLYEKMLATV